MRAFVVLGLVFFAVPSQETGLAKRLRNDLFCVEWDVKPQRNQSICFVRSITIRMNDAIRLTSALNSLNYPISPLRVDRRQYCQPSSVDDHGYFITPNVHRLMCTFVQWRQF